MNILAFDTVASASSVAVLFDGELMGSDRREMKRGHSEVLVPMIKGVISTLALSFQDLDLIAVTIGPGSFTGVRIGLATARSLSVAAKVPLVGVTSFEAVASALLEEDWDGKPVLVALETKRDDLYLQIFDHVRIQLCKPEVVASSDLVTYVKGQVDVQGGLVIAGDGAERVAETFHKKVCNFDFQLASSLIGPDAIQVANVAYENHKSGNSNFCPKPIYLRAPAVSIHITNPKKK